MDCSAVIEAVLTGSGMLALQAVRNDPPVATMSSADELFDGMVMAHVFHLPETR